MVSNPTDRTKRMGEQIKRELAMLLAKEVKDPRVRLTTIQAVEVTSDLSQAKVFITSLNDALPHKDLLDSLESMQGFLRRELSKRIQARTFPRMRFIYDTSIEYGAHLSALINQAVAEDKSNEDKNT